MREMMYVWILVLPLAKSFLEHFSPGVLARSTPPLHAAAQIESGMALEQGIASRRSTSSTRTLREDG
jgi:hypothetical protein